MLNINKLKKEDLLKAYLKMKSDEKLDQIINFYEFDDFLFSVYKSTGKENAFYHEDFKVIEENEESILKISKEYEGDLFKSKYKDIDLDTLYFTTYIIYRFYRIIRSKENNTKALENEDEIFTSNVFIHNDYKNDEKFYYRGEEDESYHLIPSLFRDKKAGDYDSIRIFESYEEKNVTHKYWEVFKENIYQDNQCFMNFLAFMQHAEEKSPYLDITYNSKVASEFACHSKKKANGAIYLFKFDKQSINQLNSKIYDLRAYFSIHILDRKIGPYTKINNHTLGNMTYRDLVCHFNTWFEQNNTRMKYQSGAFLIPRYLIIINGVPLIDFEYSGIKKYVIKSEYKQKIIQENHESNPYINYEYLMNPYSYFHKKKN